jgi:hypothetical protein
MDAGEESSLTPRLQDEFQQIRVLRQIRDVRFDIGAVDRDGRAGTLVDEASRPVWLRKFADRFVMRVSRGYLGRL